MSDNQDGSAWFWRLFGGTIMGLIGVLLMMVVNSISNSVTSVRNDAINGLQAIRLETEKQICEIKKDVGALQTKMSVVDVEVLNFKSNLKELKDDVKELETQIEALEDLIEQVKIKS